VKGKDKFLNLEGIIYYDLENNDWKLKLKWNNNIISTMMISEDSEIDFANGDVWTKVVEEKLV
jgi:hypothetical protein